MIQPLTQEEHEKLMDNPDYNNFSQKCNIEIKNKYANNEYVKKSVELINTLKEGIDLKKAEEINSS